jgi:hypothetical protein
VDLAWVGPKLRALGLAGVTGKTPQPNTLADMARDGIALTIALEHRPRLRTVTSIRSTPLAGPALMGKFPGQPGPLPAPRPG